MLLCRRVRGIQVNLSEPDGFDLPAEEEDPVDEDVVVPDLPEPPEQRPTLEEYRDTWAHLIDQHLRCVSGPFSADNLVPVPDSHVFQDCPYVPF